MIGAQAGYEPDGACRDLRCHNDPLGVGSLDQGEAVSPLIGPICVLDQRKRAIAFTRFADFRKEFYFLLCSLPFRAGHVADNARWNSLEYAFAGLFHGMGVR